ncbi:MAG: tyrosine-type recombinase/integrase [Chloroflexota bacterium]
MPLRLLESPSQSPQPRSVDDALRGLASVALREWLEWLGAHERIVPVGTTARQALARYLRQGDDAAGGVIFRSRRGGALGWRGIQQAFRRLKLRAGIPGRCSPHTLRHTFARAYLVNGGDAFSLQRILGHATLDMVKRYVALADTRRTAPARNSRGRGLGFRHRYSHRGLAAPTLRASTESQRQVNVATPLLTSADRVSRGRCRSKRPTWRRTSEIGY